LNDGPVFKAFDRRHLDTLPWLSKLDRETRSAMKAVAQVLPFRVNRYVCEELIDWDRVPDDPIYQLTFPQPSMLDADDLGVLMELLARDATPGSIEEVARGIRATLNPHPAGQIELNVPRLRGRPVRGLQHKYRETVLFFPQQGQTCHTYCTYCFRWPQFVGGDELQFASAEGHVLVDYLRAHPEVTSVLFTGGDPLVMRTKLLRRYVEPLLDAGLDHLASIRFGTKATTYWPFRFTTDSDADDLLRLFEEIRARGKHVALMAHVTHPRELETEAARAAFARIIATGAVVRCQSPVVRHVNDTAGVWRDLWRSEVRMGAIPYYMFVARDTGPKSYFEVPLVRAHEIFCDAYRAVSGLARTVRGPSMSATPGKVVVDGTARVGSSEVFVLRFLQARDPRWVGAPFFAKLDHRASWLSDLEPAFGEREFFFERASRHLEGAQSSGRSLPRVTDLA
jgi:KamA family protein